MAYDEMTAKLVRENEQLKASLRELVDVIENRILSEPWIETLHKVQTAQVLLGVDLATEPTLRKD